jgi:AcrR family transcriptional regulator
MTDAAVEAAIAAALVWLKPFLRRKPRRWQIFRREEREAVIQGYFARVLRAALESMLGQFRLPNEAEAMERLEATLRRAVEAAGHPDVAEIAERYGETIRDQWRAG